MEDVEVIVDPAVATSALEPMRARILAALSAPASASLLASRLGIPRQKVNYHLRALEKNGLVKLWGERRWGGLTERLLAASANSYVVAPEALGNAGTDPERTRDRLSASYLIAIAARAVSEVGALTRRARRTGKRLATWSLDTEVRFRSPAQRAAFSEELTQVVVHLVARYHDETSPEGRRHRLVVFAHPAAAQDESSQDKEPS